MKVVTAAEMREIDRITTEKYGVPSLTLMENAGTAVAEFVLDQYPKAQSIGVICGKGNNGGDGFVAARKLHEAGKRVKVLLLADPADVKGDAAKMLKKLPVKPIVARTGTELKKDSVLAVKDSDLLVDAILGTGFRPPLKGIYQSAVDGFADASAPVVSVDLPSGEDADEPEASAKNCVFFADSLVTFTSAKLIHISDSFGDVPAVVADIGSPTEAIQSNLQLEIIVPRELKDLLTDRAREANKGDFGHVLVVGGSLGKAGAAAMAGMASLRVGAGLVTVATPKSVLATAASFAPELMTHPLKETSVGSISRTAATEVGKILRRKTVMAIGPGLSREPNTVRFVHAAVRNARLPVVIDADGLNAFENHTDKLDGRKRPLILTPHPGEMARLTGLTIERIQRNRIKTARVFARKHHVIVVLKGDHTLVAEPDGKVWINMTGNPALATAGTGDILTGMISGMIAQHPTEIVAATCLAVFLHGLAGDILHEESLQLIATDLLAAYPRALRKTVDLAWHPKHTWISGFPLLPST